MFDRVTREERVAPGNRDRPGRGRQEPPPARAGRQGDRAARLAADAGRPLPRLRLRASPTGRWARSSATSSGSPTPTSPRSPSTACAPASRSSWATTASEGEEDSPDRAGGDPRPPARHRGSGRVRRERRLGRPPAGARPPVLGGQDAGRGREPRAPRRLRDRGHPLGRRGNARPDRVPRALGARPGPDDLPRARRAARPPARLGRRPPQRDDDRARAARRPTGARELVHALLPDGAEEIEEALVAQVAERSGGNPLFAEEMVNRILEEGDVRGRRPARDRPRRAGRAPRRARRQGALAAPAGVGRRPDLLGRLGRRGRRTRTSSSARWPTRT